MTSMIPCGDFKTGYSADTTIFPTTTSRNMVILGIAVLCLAPLVMDKYALSLLIQIGYLGIAALGLNILVGFTGQISIGHAAFFGFGAFTSAYLSNRFGIPVFFCIPLAGVVTAAVGLVFGLPAARLKGLYLAIATLAAQYILLDFFAAPNGSPVAAFPPAPSRSRSSATCCAAINNISMSCWPMSSSVFSWSPT